MATNFLWYAGASANSGLVTASFNFQTTEMNSLTTGSIALSSVGGSSGKFTNSTTSQAIYADLFLTLGAIGSACSTGANLAGWFITSPDSGTTYEVTSVVPPRPPDFIVPLPATTISGGSVYRNQGIARLPALQFKVLVQNNSGQTFAASANTLACATYAMQY